jgi:glyoxylase-like metal-dependent hydrolase (beta-lactamase superfamily II)
MLKLFGIILLSSVLFGNIYKFNPVKITSNITCFIGEFHPPTKQNNANVSNVCYIDTGKNLVVIEAGPTYFFAKEFAQMIEKKENKKISAVIVSNYHDDRIYGASYYKKRGIDIIGYKNIIDDINKNSEKFQRLPALLPKKIFKNTKLVYPNILVKNNYLIKGKNLDIKILKLSKISNAPSDIAIYVPKENFIFVGNIIFNNRMIKYHHDSNLEQWLEALKKLSSMGIKHIVSGHGDDFGKNSYKETKRYLETLQKVKKQYNNDIAMEDIKIDFSSFKNKTHYKDLVNGNVRRFYMQLEWEQ